MKYLKRVQAVKRFQIFTANMTGSSLVGICFFAAVSPHFKELYLVASRQEFVGIYMNGKQIAEVAKSDPVIKPDMMRQHMLGPTGLELQEFCQEMTNTVQKFLSGVETFEL